MLMAHSRIYPLQNQEVVINNKTMIKIWTASQTHHFISFASQVTQHLYLRSNCIC